MHTTTTMTAAAVTPDNAYRHADNYAIESEDGLLFVGLEHNREEADAVANYLTNEKGRRFVVLTNGKDVVRAAKAIRPDAARSLRYVGREEAFRVMRSIRSYRR